MACTQVPVDAAGNRINPRWLDELAAADNPVSAGYFWVPDGFPAPLRPLPAGFVIVVIDAFEQRGGRLQAAVWVRHPDGRMLRSVWSRRGRWLTWRPMSD